MSVEKAERDFPSPTTTAAPPRDSTRAWIRKSTVCPFRACAFFDVTFETKRALPSVRNTLYTRDA